MARSPKLTTETLRSAAVSERRSSLYLWMLANFDQFSSVVAEAGRPNWGKLATAFSEAGLTDLKNRPVTPERTRLTWWKVRKAVEARRAREAAKNAQQPAQAPVPPTQPTTAAPTRPDGMPRPPPVARPVTPQQDQDPEDEPPPDKFEFKPGRPR